MSLWFSVLASGSAGNCSAVVREDRATRRVVLLDAGLSIRQTRQRLGELGLGIDDVTDILLTHLDHDHYRSVWSKLAYKKRINIHVHHCHRHPALRADVPGERLRIFHSAFDLCDGAARVTPVLLAHDSSGSIGYVIEHNGLRLGWATDLGHVPEHLFDHFVDLDALAFESNYDRRMQLDSARPMFLKRRIMGGAGHLSNDQSIDAVRRLSSQCSLSQLALLHLSRQCNHPRLVQSLYAQEASELVDRLTITSQHHATPMLRVHRRNGARVQFAPRSGEQLVLF